MPMGFPPSGIDPLQVCASQGGRHGKGDTAEHACEASTGVHVDEEGNLQNGKGQAAETKVRGMLAVAPRR
eukprot:3342619-Prorocentrum_lima.AAC.1